MQAGKRSVEKEKRRAYWRGIVEEAERSGASIRAFCRQRRVKEHLFCRWRLAAADSPRRRRADATRGAGRAVRGAMIALPAAVQGYLCTIACEMRRGFDGLRMPAATVVGVDPMGGHLLVCCSRRADRLKILYWDGNGWALWWKRLERGTYAFPFEAAGRRQITGGELSARLEGIDLRGARKRKRHVPRLQHGPETGAAGLTKPL